MNRKEHWEAAYADGPSEVSWYQPRPEISLELIGATGASLEAAILDVGGGASTLVDCLLDAGRLSVAVLDISASALAQARTRLAARASLVTWFEADVTKFDPPSRFAVWHDRAVFHFLTAPEDRRAYVDTLMRALQPGGDVIIATFAPDGPLKCSGLEIVRYDEASIAAELGAAFVLRESRRETHRTPWQTVGGITVHEGRHLACGSVFNDDHGVGAAERIWNGFGIRIRIPLPIDHEEILVAPWRKVDLCEPDVAIRSQRDGGGIPGVEIARKKYSAS
jgi:2-polyprenyl-3-methyl-5-hydroxy-6-metoxy-1,4-benzoquinol methylase